MDSSLYRSHNETISSGVITGGLKKNRFGESRSDIRMFLEAIAVASLCGDLKCLSGVCGGDTRV